MKLKFKQQQYQEDAAMSVVNCFKGQPNSTRKEIVGRTELFAEEIFSNDKIKITGEELLSNVKKVQEDNGLIHSKKLEGYNFTIEMETGTGKTYVYTKTMYELNKHYGWNKFIIMVPSVAIREGVHKSMEITEEHFQEIYGKKIRYFIYDTKNKSNLVNIKNFADTSNIEVIIMNYQAFATRSKESRKIYQELDTLQTEKPIDIIKRARPILIIDEPQRFGKTAEKIFKDREFEQLFTLRYSATHKKDYNKIYRLDAIDAYNHKLVKKISVKGIEVIGNTGTNSFLFLDRIQLSTKENPTAYIEMEVKQSNGIRKKIVKVKEEDNLFILSNELQQYKNQFVVKEINGQNNTVTFLNGIVLEVGQTNGDVDEKHIRRIQIRETIRSHLEKERVLFNKGIKVLSLFFIDEVARYRMYDENNNQLKGEYAEIFEDVYKNHVKELLGKDYISDSYKSYLKENTAEIIHNGYFSIDKKGHFIDSKENRAEGNISNDVNAYDLIMKNKEQLLSLDEPTRFIFSHSALREGWDNPNIFQICTLKQSQSTISKRQEIGRGLRISVNNNGDRMDFTALENDFFDINKLTVVASESYDKFAKELQKEIYNSLSDRPVILKVDVLKTKLKLSDNLAMDLLFDMKAKGYLNDNYQITDKTIDDIGNDTFEVPEKLTDKKKSIIDLVRSVHTSANFKVTENETSSINEPILEPNDNFYKKEFQNLWNKIKVRTAYEVDFDSDEFINKCVKSIDEHLIVNRVLLNIIEIEQIDKIESEDLKSGKSMQKSVNGNITEKVDSFLGSVKYDLIAEITKECYLTRKTAVAILKNIKSKTFAKYKTNPENFIKNIIKIINDEKATTLINSITYSKTDKTYGDDIFTINNFKGVIGKNIKKVKRHIYDYVKTDSEVERKLTEDLESGEVEVYAKLPGGFKIPTPIGNYNPDWAIVFNKEKFKYIYFIVETKGSLDSLQLRAAEKTKIECAKKHFSSLSDKNIKYSVVKNYSDLKNILMK